MAADNTVNSTLDSNIPTYRTINVKVQEVNLNISAIHNQKPSKPTILFLHGFGGTKEDYADFLNHHPLPNTFSFLSFDAPGCGQTTCPTPENENLLIQSLSIPFLTQTALEVLAALNITHFHLVGHSMGGLTALLLAHNLRTTDRLLSFINIKGNLAPEDCFLSRQVFNYPSNDPELFFADFVHRTARSASMGSALYAANLRHKVRAPHGVITSAIFRSMVQMSDEEDLMGWFLELGSRGVRTMFMYGEENWGLSYLGKLKKEGGVELAMVPRSGHFVMYSNPPVMWRFIEDFLTAGGG